MPKIKADRDIHDFSYYALSLAHFFSWLIIRRNINNRFFNDVTHNQHKISKRESNLIDRNKMNSNLPTCKQLEKSLSQNIRAFYLREINHPPQNISCKLFSRYIAISADKALTPLECNLWESGEEELTIEVRSEINNIFKPKLTSIVEEILNIKVDDILSNVTFAGNRLCTLIILSQPPLYRESKSSSRLKKHKIVR